MADEALGGGLDEPSPGVRLGSSRCRERGLRSVSQSRSPERRPRASREGSCEGGPVLLGRPRSASPGSPPDGRRGPDPTPFETSQEAAARLGESCSRGSGKEAVRDPGEGRRQPRRRARVASGRVRDRPLPRGGPVRSRGRRRVGRGTRETSDRLPPPAATVPSGRRERKCCRAGPANRRSRRRGRPVSCSRSAEPTTGGESEECACDICREDDGGPSAPLGRSATTGSPAHRPDAFMCVLWRSASARDRRVPVRHGARISPGLGVRSRSSRRLAGPPARRPRPRSLLWDSNLVAENPFSLYRDRRLQLGCAFAPDPARESGTCTETTQPCGFAIFLYKMRPGQPRGVFLVQTSVMYKL